MTPESMTISCPAASVRVEGMLLVLVLMSFFTVMLPDAAMETEMPILSEASMVVLTLPPPLPAVQGLVLVGRVAGQVGGDRRSRSGRGARCRPLP